MRHLPGKEAKVRHGTKFAGLWYAVDAGLSNPISSMLCANLETVFLRLLEYYKGVMLLTTNRVDELDPAFESRIHLTINYPKLDLDSRLKVWRTFVAQKKVNEDGAAKSPTFAISEEDLRELARLELNGREIKNVVKTATLLAVRDETPVKMEHIQIVLRVKRGERAERVGPDVEDGSTSET